jgi:class 3 adenylate cyclase/predicted ATPase
MPAATIAEWLTDVGLQQYIELFEREQIDFRVLPELTDADLVQLGLPLGPRKLLLKAISGVTAAAAQAAPTRPSTGTLAQAERRQLTVMFCDLVGSTQLSQKLDPEALRELMTRYQHVCAVVVDKYHGHVAQYLGDGIMAYFGWPKAHEDDAERSIRAGLEIQAAIQGAIAQEPLQVRIGIATGPVVVGETGDGDASVPKAAVGETPNVASRLQALAAAGQVVISAATHRLIGRVFACRDLGDQILKGVVEPVRAFVVDGLGSEESRFEAKHGGDLTPFIGREDEVSLLLRRWQSACDGDGHVTLLGGEPGIGKSRIVRELRDRLAGADHHSLRCQCSPYYTNTALHPYIAMLERTATFAPGDSAQVRLDKLERMLAALALDVGSGAPLLAALLSVESADRYPAIRTSPQRQKEDTLSLLAEIVFRLARQRPVLFVFEDVHWIDPTSLEVLDLLVSRISDQPILLVLSFRPEFAPPWVGQSQVTFLSLNRLARRQAVALVARVTQGTALPDALLDEIVAKTDGVPLFVEELTKAVLESGLVRLDGAHYSLNAPMTSLAIPSTLQDSLMARLDRLSEVREVAQIGACIGREFSYQLLAAVSDLDESKLRAALDQLATSELAFCRGEPPQAVYTFKHALVQDAAYNSLLRSRRQVLHGLIAGKLTQRFPEWVASEPELMAHHCSAAGMNEEAVRYWLTAGQRAIERFANAEAINHVHRGFELLETLPADEARDKLELLLQMTLGTALGAKGYTSEEVGAAFERARELCQHVGDMPQMFPILYGLWTNYIMRSQFQTSYDLGRQILELGTQADDGVGILVGTYALSGTQLFRGEFQAAAEQADAALARYDKAWNKTLTATFGYSPGPGAADWGSVAWWFRGYPDKARQRGEWALQLAREADHPLTLATVLVHRAFLEAMRGDVRTARSFSEQTIQVAGDTGILIRQAEGQMIQGWAIARMGEPERGIRQLLASLDVWHQVGAYIGDPTWLGLLADAYAAAGRFEEAHEALSQAFDTIDKFGERLWEAGLNCLKGRLYLDGGDGDAAKAEACFRKGIEVARHQDGKMLELHAAMHLARLLSPQGKRQEARELLNPIYNWFSEGFDTKDLIEGKALLQELAEF